MSFIRTHVINFAKHSFNVKKCNDFNNNLNEDNELLFQENVLNSSALHSL